MDKTKLPETFREFLMAELGNESEPEESYLQDLVEHGAAAGFPGLTYYSDTVILFEKYQDEIFEALGEDADEVGQSILELIASFNGAKDVGSYTQFANLLTWYMAERVARLIIEEPEEDED